MLFASRKLVMIWSLYVLYEEMATEQPPATNPEDRHIRPRLEAFARDFLAARTSICEV
jgi:hypothetical protein